MGNVLLHPKHFMHNTENTLICRRELWDFMYALGGAFGWQPLGTTYRSLSIKPRPAMRPHDYIPGSSRDAKRVTEGDALAWAGALHLALDSPHLDNMLAAQRRAQPPFARDGLDDDIERRIGIETRDDIETREDIEGFSKMLHRGALLFAMNESSSSVVVRNA